MPMRFRIDFAAALAFLLAAAPASAQEVPDNRVVGAPELRDFRLPGTRVVPAPANTAEPATPPASPPPAAEDTGETPAPARQTPAPAAAAPAQQPQRSAPRPAPPADGAPSTETIEASPAPSQEALFEGAAVDDYRAEDFARAPAPAAVDRPAADPQDLASGGGVMWPALAAGLALLAALFFVQRRRRAALAGGEAVARSVAPEVAEVPAPLPRPSQAQLRKEDEALRPALELEFTPERMVATDAQAAVHFGLMVRNTGNGPARNLRIEAQMFNASAQQKQEIEKFLARPAQSDGAEAALNLQPGQSAGFRSSVVMPKENVREIQVDGRALFIPTVAVRIVYQWGNGRSGRTHGTYLIGIQNQQSPEKMGPFRLDLGPRIYRSVGGRQIEMARAS